MSFIFGKPKTPSPPKVPPPAAIPTTPSTNDAAALDATRRKGFASTILTGDLAPANTGKKKLLGG